MLVDRDFSIRCFLCSEHSPDNVHTADEAKAWVEMCVQYATDPQAIKLRLIGRREAIVK